VEEGAVTGKQVVESTNSKKQTDSARLVGQAADYGQRSAASGSPVLGLPQRPTTRHTAASARPIRHLPEDCTKKAPLAIPRTPKSEQQSDQPPELSSRIAQVGGRRWAKGAEVGERELREQRQRGCAAMSVVADAVLLA